MIVMYHNVVPAHAPQGIRALGITLTHRQYARQVAWLRRRYTILRLDEYLDAVQRGRASRLLTITFDDGTATTYDAVKDVAEETRTAATIFVSTCQLDDGPLIWGGYLNALCLDSTYADVTFDGETLPLGSRQQREQARRRLYSRIAGSPDPAAAVAPLTAAYPIDTGTLRFYRGMTSAQLADAGRSAHVEIGSHTVTHPFLSRCSDDVERHELTESRRVLEQKTARAVRYFAYPSGDYSERTIRQAHDAGYDAGFAVASKRLGDAAFEWPRVGIFHASIPRLFAKLWMAGRPAHTT